MTIWNLHSHSRFSANDALSDVKDMVKTVVGFGQPALGLTDHGNMAGSIQLYNECNKAGIKPFPGSELYVVHDRNDTKAKRHHMCVVAFTTQGYENLVKLSTLTHRNFYNKPILDHADLAQLSEDGLLKGIAATSGCYFGFIAQAIVNNDPMQAVNLMKSYDKWFDKFYVELQNHNIVHDEDGLWNDDLLAGQIMAHAQKNGIPAVLTQDSHYCEHDDQEVHNALKRLVSFGPDPEDATFPGDGFGLADDQWLRDHHDDKRFAYGAEGLADLLASHDLSIPQLDDYHYSIPFTVDDPDAVLRKKCYQSLDNMKLGKSKKHVDRLEDELSVIADTGMAGYILMVEETTDWCRANKVLYQARGSASGSMVCWLRGITQFDPLKWNLSFERFISRDRTKPPDIDLDVEHTRRAELIEYLRGRFAVTQIGTYSEYSLHGDEEESSGSLRVKYYTARNRAGDPVHEWAAVPEEQKALLAALSDFKPFASYGVHPAGLVITTTHEELDSLVPLMKVASSKTYVTQYEMKDIEKLGLVKLDVLGLKTLSTLHICMDNLGRDVFAGLDWIPLSDPATYQSISKGNTEGVFQLEGYTAQKGCTRLKPTTIKDVIAAMALFRPATMNSGATESYMARRRREEDVPTRHPIIMKHTTATYGIMLFQEQVISILRDLGMTPDDLTDFLKAVKASNESIGDAGKVIAGYKQMVKDMAIDAEFSKADWDWLWGAIEGFAAYGFNQAHSTAYGITAYRCAYLATHHPVEFFAALLRVAEGATKAKGDKLSKEQIYLAAARSRGISVRRADVNLSGASYGVDVNKKYLRKGIASIKGIGPKQAAEIIKRRPAGGYTSLYDFCTRVNRVTISGIKSWMEDGDADIGTLGRLIDIGAMDSILELDRPVDAEYLLRLKEEKLRKAQEKQEAAERREAEAKAKEARRVAREEKKAAKLAAQLAKEAS